VTASAAQQLRAVLFDIDGTLAETEHQPSLQPLRPAPRLTARDTLAGIDVTDLRALLADREAADSAA
jgi:FMN phosphatase YigB (HAD superfamily)